MDRPRKLLIQMSGAPGSGKTTLAKLLAPAIDGVAIDHDFIKSFFLENDIVFAQSGRLAYRFQWTLAEEMIKQGRNVIIDCPCNYDHILNQGTTLAQKHGYKYKYIECKCSVDDIDLLDQRLRSRVPTRSQRTGVSRPPRDANNVDQSNEEYHALFRKWIESPYRPASDIIVVGSASGMSPEECRDHVLKELAPTIAIEQNSNVAGKK